MPKIRDAQRKMDQMGIGSDFEPNSNSIQLSKRASKIVLVLFLATFLTIIYFITRSFFMSSDGFDIDALSFASEAQIEMVKSTLQPGTSINESHSVITRTSGYYMNESQDVWLFGSRMKVNGEELKVIYFALVGDLNDPVDTKLIYESDTNYASVGPVYTAAQLKSKRGFFSGFTDLSRYFRHNFDIPEKRTRGLKWSIYGLGASAIISEN